MRRKSKTAHTNDENHISEISEWESALHHSNSWRNWKRSKVSERFNEEREISADKIKNYWDIKNNKSIRCTQSEIKVIQNWKRNKQHRESCRADENNIFTQLQKHWQVHKLHQKWVIREHRNHS